MNSSLACSAESHANTEQITKSNKNVIRMVWAVLVSCCKDRDSHAFMEHWRKRWEVSEEEWYNNLSTVSIKRMNIWNSVDQFKTVLQICPLSLLRVSHFYGNHCQWFGISEHPISIKWAEKVWRHLIYMQWFLGLFCYKADIASFEKVIFEKFYWSENKTLCRIKPFLMPFWVH